MCAKSQRLDRPRSTHDNLLPSVAELIQDIVAEVMAGRPFGSDRTVKHGPDRNGKRIKIRILREVRQDIPAIPSTGPAGRGGLKNKSSNSPSDSIKMVAVGCSGGSFPVSLPKNSVVGIGVSKAAHPNLKTGRNSQGVRKSPSNLRRKKR